MSFGAIFCTGFVMAMVRTYEPYYRFLLKKNLVECFGVEIEEPEDGIKAEVLSTFLSSSLNIELVYIILTGVTRFSASENKLERFASRASRVGSEA